MIRTTRVAATIVALVFALFTISTSSAHAGTGGTNPFPGPGPQCFQAPCPFAATIDQGTFGTLPTGVTAHAPAPIRKHHHRPPIR